MKNKMNITHAERSVQHNNRSGYPFIRYDSNNHNKVKKLLCHDFIFFLFAHQANFAHGAHALQKNGQEVNGSAGNNVTNYPGKLTGNDSRYAG